MKKCTKSLEKRKKLYSIRENYRKFEKIKKNTFFSKQTFFQQKCCEKKVKKNFCFEKFFVFYFLVLSYLKFDDKNFATKISPLAALELELWGF